MKKTAKKTVFILLAVFMLQLSVVSAAFAKNSLSIGESLSQGQMLSSNNGRFNLVMQTDGNLVLYKDAGNPIWSTSTNGAAYVWRDPITGYTTRRSPQLLTLSAGLLRVTDQFKDFTFWRADTQGWSNAHYQGNVPAGLIGDSLVVQDDGNVVLYSSGKGPVWASNTNGR
ncbi:hypothetical protein Q5741_00775 [Paenibacillus sp. JX-17]|uniref:Bulb-type lectin domain-containing protein n=1 Tax=Paenibacillus lacisoli TaxID=3064525 RepID=A0ABT9C6Q3_9BACL|nr:hypothetical protein [Paenibacillus sp. JX-17]MDO7904942.1 hypothetical protein [Paenibacillus sp. JX-17]